MADNEVIIPHFDGVAVYLQQGFMKYRWVEKKVENDSLVRSLSAELNNLPIALTQALVLRGVDSFDAARSYFRPSIEHTHDPFLMADMNIAAGRVAAAINNRERIVVYGDYDVDGVTSTALMLTFLQDLGGDADYFIPHRLFHGYGLSEMGIDAAMKKEPALIIALDCGITAVDPADYAAKLGVDLIIADHHTVPKELPSAVAVLNPKRPDCEYPFDELSGCGVGFKLAQAVLRHMQLDESRALQYLDLVALSIASDIVPLTGENRVLMREGLARIRSSPRLGLTELARCGLIDLTKCNTSQIVFQIAPRLNAAGRMEDASLGVDLLTSDNPGQAKDLARKIEQVNDARRKEDRKVLDGAMAQAEQHFVSRQRNGLVLFDPTWHAGIIGITASRIVERFFRPTVMLTRVGDVVKGSVRSIEGVNVFDALKACENHLIQFGGHKYAAGLSLPEENVPAFSEAFDTVLADRITPEMLVPSIKIDGTLELSEISPRFWPVLKQFEPFGPLNSRPVFRSRKLQIVGTPRTVGRKDEHLKFTVRSDEASIALDAIGFGLGGQAGTALDSQRSGKHLDVVFTLEESTWNGRSFLQLKAKDFRPAEEHVAT